MIATCAEAKWSERTARLKFGIGALAVFSVRFRAAVRDEPWQTPPADPDDTAAAFRSDSSGVRALLLTSHPVSGKVARVVFRRDYLRYCRMQFRRFFIDIEGSFEDYLARFERRRRHHLRGALKRFAAGGPIDWREYRGERDIAEFYRLAREVSRKTYQENLCGSGLPATTEFLNGLKEAARQDSVRGYILFAEGKPIAYQYCPVRESAITYERIGYDPAFGKQSPGTVLLLLTLQHLFETREFRRFDFGVGDHEYKERLATGHVRCAEIYYFRHGVGNTSLVLMHAALNTLWEITGALLERAGVRQRLKSLMRVGYGVRYS